MVTWQTQFGREHDNISQLFAVNADIADIAQIAGQSQVLSTFFDRFCEEIAALPTRLGFELWSCSMELNSADAAVLLFVYIIRGMYRIDGRAGHLDLRGQRRRASLGVSNGCLFAAAAWLQSQDIAG